MKKSAFLRNLLAAFGAVFLVVILILFVVTLSFKGGIGYGDKVAVVNLKGVITDSTEITARLRELADRKDVKAVILRIDTPGGAVGPSQEIHRSVKRLESKKPVVASMGAVAASGGYYAASAATKIVANPGTITGSIGVIIEYLNASELMKKLGIKGYVVKSGKYKDVGSPMRSMNEDERRMLSGVINDVNSQFIRAVAEGRHLKVKEVKRIADGRIFTGAQAKKKGLVDLLGDMTDAVELGARLAGIKGSPNVIYPGKSGLGFLKSALNTQLGGRFTDFFSGIRLMYLMPGS